MKIGLGTVQFGMSYGIANHAGKVSQSEVFNIIQLAKERFISTIDTAMNYGDSESTLGSVGMETFKVVTKLSKVPEDLDSIDNWISEKIATSLKNLKISSLYGLLIHYPEQLLDTKGKEIYAALRKNKEKGLINKIGISVYSPESLFDLIKFFDIDLVQAPLNLIDRRFVNTGSLKKLKDKNIEIHTRSAFLQGLLLMKKSERPEKFNIWNDIWRDWDFWLNSNKISPVIASISYPLSFSEVDQVIIGVNNYEQLKQITDNLKGDKLNLPDLTSTDIRLINPSLWGDL